MSKVAQAAIPAADGVIAGRPTASRASRTGLSLAMLSAATFGLSGPLAKSLLDAGWSAGAAVLLRLAGAAAVLAIPTLLLLRGQWRSLWRNSKTLLLYGVVAVGGLQICFFNAVHYLSVGVALMIEYLAPVLMIFWSWWRTKRAPGRRTSLGAAVAVIGMGFVVGIGSGVSVNLIGVAWGLTAALCLCCYFVMAGNQQDDLPPLLLAAGGTTVGAAAVAIAGVIGLAPLTFTANTTRLAGNDFAWFVPGALLVLVPTVIAYLTGVAAIGRLGAKLASFVALTEVLFAVLASWLLLGEWPHAWQLFGGACILAGVTLVRQDEPAR
ncbi:EamA family transporter [Jatrophihabitans sp. DSM 45814]